MLNNNISFTSRINFVSRQEFEKVTSHVSRDINNQSYIGSPWDKVKTSGEGLTDNAQRCIAGGLTNTNSADVAFFHFTPPMLCYLNSVKSQILEGLNKMGQYTENLGGLIVGGCMDGYKDPYVVSKSESEFLADGIRNLFKKVKASFSEFTGQKNYSCRTDVFYRGHDDSWFINYSKNSNDQIKNIDDIKNAYENIHVCDKDEVFINGQKINKEILNQRRNSA